MASENKNAPFSINDKSSFSNPEDVHAEDIKFVWNLDFDRQRVSGCATYNLVARNTSVQNLILDIRDITIKSITDEYNNDNIEYSIGESVPEFGAPLSIKVPHLDNKSRGTIKIEYECSHEAPALKWLTKEQTLMKTHPYLFSKGNLRSLFPCQDTPSTKATYTAEITTRADLEVLMSAVKLESHKINESERLHKFEQKIPIPSYLVTIVAGDIKSKRVGPRSQVWAEEGILETAAFDLSETEQKIQMGEKLFGEFVWGVYDVLILPPSFPVGGMEYPCLTFVSPSIVTGDKSLAGTVTHEICHSWFGNLVTNKNFEHFWLNEGFTVFASRKIIESMEGPKSKDFDAIGGWKELTECVKVMKPDNRLTCLVPDLTGVSPADAFSTVPYEKGYAFLCFLENKVGGPDLFEPFLRHYVVTNRYKSIDTDIFKSQFIEYFSKMSSEELIADIDWEGWLYTPGMPLVKPKFDTSLADVCTALKIRWVNWNTTDACPFQQDDLKEFSQLQMIEFVAQLLDEDTLLGTDKVVAMQYAYDFHSISNSELKFRWLALCLKNQWMDAVPIALKFASENGRMKLILPIYRQMYAFEPMRHLALENFSRARPFMMHQSARAVAQAFKQITVD